MGKLGKIGVTKPIVISSCLYNQLQINLIRFSKSSSDDYPWIQEFRSQYDFLIVGGGMVGSCIANSLAERIKVGLS